MEEKERFPLLGRKMLEGGLESSESLPIGGESLRADPGIGDPREGLLLVRSAGSRVTLPPPVLRAERVEGDVPSDAEEPGAQRLAGTKCRGVLEGAAHGLVGAVLNIRVVLRSSEHARHQHDDVGAALGKGIHRGNRDSGPGGAPRVGASERERKQHASSKGPSRRGPPLFRFPDDFLATLGDPANERAPRSSPKRELLPENPVIGGELPAKERIVSRFERNDRGGAKGETDPRNTMALSLTNPSFPLTLLGLTLTGGALANEPLAPAPIAVDAEPPAPPEVVDSPASPPVEIREDSSVERGIEGRAEPSVATTGAPASNSVDLRRVLHHAAAEETILRIGEGAAGLASAGALLGAGFAAEGADMTWSHSLWVSSGITAAASLVRLFLPSELESFAGSASEKSDEQLRREWRELAERALVERRTGAVFGTLVGATSLVFGSLVLGDELGDLTDDQRKILGTALLAGGGIGIAQSAVDWFLPSPTERGFALVEEGPSVRVSASPTPGGFHLGVQGVF